MLIIGLAGQRGAGKSTIAEIINQQFRFPVISLVDKARSFLKSGKKENIFDKISKISLTLQKKLESDSVGELFFNEIQDYFKKRTEEIVMNSIRTKFNKNFFRKISNNFFMIGVYASGEEWYHRIKVRKRIDN